MEYISIWPGNVSPISGNVSPISENVTDLAAQGAISQTAKNLRLRCRIPKFGRVGRHDRETFPYSRETLHMAGQRFPGLWGTDRPDLGKRDRLRGPNDYILYPRGPGELSCSRIRHRPVLRRMIGSHGNSARTAEIQRNRHLLGPNRRDFARRDSAADCVGISPWGREEKLGCSPTCHPTGSAAKWRDSGGIPPARPKFREIPSYLG